jgi:hypothetical protein
VVLEKGDVCQEYRPPPPVCSRSAWYIGGGARHTPALINDLAVEGRDNFVRTPGRRDEPFTSGQVVIVLQGRQEIFLLVLDAW